MSQLMLASFLFLASASAQDAAEAPPTEAPASASGAAEAPAAGTPEAGESGEAGPAQTRQAAEQPSGEAQPKAAQGDATPSEAAPAEEPEVPKAVLDGLFEGAVSAFHGGDHEQAAVQFFDFLRQSPEADERYEWAEYMLAQSFEALGYVHAAVEYHFNVVKNRRVPRLMTESLSVLERLARTEPYDRVMVEKVLIDDMEFPSHLPTRLNDFVHYVQGHRNLKRGNHKWAEASFAKLRGDGLYKMRADFYRALWLIPQKRDAEAIPVFERLASWEPEESVDPVAEEVVRDDARETLARLSYGRGDYAKAWSWYRQVVDPHRVRYLLPVEKAWTLYYLEDWSHVLGLLYAMQSPRFRGAFLPDQFVMRGIILSNLCHFRAAAAAVDEFRARYGPSLAAIRNRTDLVQDPSMFGAALQSPRAARLDRFLATLKEESGQADKETAWRRKPLGKHLRVLYGLQVEETERHWRAALQVAFKNISTELLEFEEQLNLLNYEVGISLYRRVKKSEQPQEEREAKLPEVPMGGGTLYLRPGGEYWNEELHNYVVFIQDRCDARTRLE